MESEDSYELERQRIIRENQELLESLGLGGLNKVEPKIVNKRPVTVSKPASRSSARISSIRTTTTITTASSRFRGSTSSTAKTIGSSKERSLRDFVREDSEDHLLLRSGEGLGKGVALARLYSPKRFGAIPGVPLFKAWPLRAGASMDSVHAPLVACISGNPVVGAWSVCFSGGYEDNQDRGESFVLTGAGGRDLKGNGKNLRTAGQSFDQSFDHAMNGALKRSSETGKVVRVTRGYKTDSEYAPVEGYRYDGLYTVTSAKLVRSPATGFKVCVFEFKRVKGQKRIPKRSEMKVLGDGAEESEEEGVVKRDEVSIESYEVDEVEAQVAGEEARDDEMEEEVERKAAPEPSRRRSARVKETPIVVIPQSSRRVPKSKVERIASPVEKKIDEVKKKIDKVEKKVNKVEKKYPVASRRSKRSAVEVVVELEAPQRRSKRVRA